jgi:hypothetical protein
MLSKRLVASEVASLGQFSEKAGCPLDCPKPTVPFWKKLNKTYS